MKITIIGTGFVGVVTSAVYASFGHEIVGLDIDSNKIKQLEKSIVPFYEPQLEELLKQQQENGNLTFTTDYKKAVKNADIVMIAVGTPSTAEGKADLTYVMASAVSAAPHLKQGAIVVIKSTVPPGTHNEVRKELKKHTNVSFSMASLPEFLREGSAVQDTLNPDRVVIGAENKQDAELLEKLHSPLKAPIIHVSPTSAQMGKYTANAYLATRITFINQIADLCEKNGADVTQVMKVIGEDNRIGSHYWYPGLGYGGSCFPKDVKELAYYSQTIGEGNNLFNKVHELNSQRINKKLRQFEEVVGTWQDKTVAVLGLAFKPNTNDMREAPSLTVIPHLIASGAEVIAYDPKAIPEAKALLGEEKITYEPNLEKAVKNADVIMVLIEWPEIISFEYKKRKEEVWFIDTRDQFNPQKIEKLGFRYIGIGR